MTLVECGFCKLMFEPCCGFYDSKAYGMYYFLHMCTDHGGNKAIQSAPIQYNQLRDMKIFKTKVLKGIIFHTYDKNCVHDHKKFTN